ncbi:MAG: hypothetical protein CVU38_03910 [Chloroflexi bacterium HGW-Chloroflexi-1]|nr:MAG: hypothetical protein CVU38_03910 [Chloroflexi bacterium HGW-Chloroflexi-1]
MGIGYWVLGIEYQGLGIGYQVLGIGHWRFGNCDSIWSRPRPSPFPIPNTQYPRPTLPPPPAATSGYRDNCFPRHNSSRPSRWCSAARPARFASPRARCGSRYRNTRDGWGCRRCPAAGRWRSDERARPNPGSVAGWRSLRGSSGGPARKAATTGPRRWPAPARP